MKIKYFAHSAFQITTGNYKILIDPFLSGNPNNVENAATVKADFIVLTHAHGDHLGDSFDIAERCGSLFICVNELANYCISKGFKAHNMHIGGSHAFNFGKVKFTIAHHGSITPDNQYAGEASGVLLTIEGKTIYHTGDTGLFYDMKLIGEMNNVDLMLLPIGDNFTMGIDDAIKAVEFVKPKLAIPMHYNTFSVIESDPFAFKEKCEKIGVKSRVLNFGEEFIL